jgi:hypothetical protein
MATRGQNLSCRRYESIHRFENTNMEVVRGIRNSWNTRSCESTVPSEFRSHDGLDWWHSAGGLLAAASPNPSVDITAPRPSFTGSQYRSWTASRLDEAA